MNDLTFFRLIAFLLSSMAIDFLKTKMTEFTIRFTSGH